MSKVWVVVAKGFEYNDEVYEEQQGGSPVIGFRSQEAAEEECHKRNLAAYKDVCLGHYCYDLADLQASKVYDPKTGGWRKEGDVEDLVELMRELGFAPDEWDEFCLEKLGKKQLRRVYDACSLRFYQVAEMEMAE